VRRGTLIALLVLFVVIVVAAFAQNAWVKGYRRSPLPTPSQGHTTTATP
jgi:hypothetical protein